MEQEIIFTIGIPAAGKSTWQLEFMKSNLNYVVIERDDIRMKFFSVEMCSNQDEKLVTQISDSIAKIALEAGKSVIFSNTNVNVKNLNKEIVKWQSYANISFKIFDIELEEAIRRNSLRERKVPEFIIRNMHKNFLLMKESFDFSEILKIN
jgi:predicted kinase